MQTRQHKQLLRFIPIFLMALAILSPLAITDAQDGTQPIHVVQAGENLFRIALRYGVTVDAIAAANGITDVTRIYAGQQLIIPTGATVAPAPVQPESAAPVAPPVVTAPDVATYHIVEAGQTLASIGRQYGVGWLDLATWNGISDPNQIFAGQRLVVSNPSTTSLPETAAVAGPTIVEAAPAAVSPAPAPTADRTYTVQRGDNLSSIARQFGLTWTTIARVNNLSNPSQIFAGQVLIIPAVDDAAGTGFVPTGGVPSAPAPTIATGKQVIVDLSDQMVYAYENGVLLRSTSASSGLPGTATVLGDYRVYWKLTSQTMSGPGYYLPGVPWVMYFYQGYALHGTYWHNNFGQPMSHGCVNMPTDEAEWFFRWTEVGTPVRVQS